jgi:hypothetical protein
VKKHKRQRFQEGEKRSSQENQKESGRREKKTNITGVVLDAEGLTTELEVRVGGALTETLLEGLVGSRGDTVHGLADVVEDEEDTRGLLSFDELAHDLVVEEVDG